MLIGIIVAARGVRIESEVVTRLAFKPLFLVLSTRSSVRRHDRKLGLALAVLAVVVVGYLANARGEGSSC